MKTSIDIPLVGEVSEFDPVKDVMVVVIAASGRYLKDPKWKIHIGRSIRQGVADMAYFGTMFHSASIASLTEAFAARKQYNKGFVIMVNGMARHIPAPMTTYNLQYNSDLTEIVTATSEEILNFNKGNLHSIGNGYYGIGGSNFVGKAEPIMQGAGIVGETVLQLAGTGDAEIGGYNDVVCLNFSRAYDSAIGFFCPSLSYVSYRTVSAPKGITCFVEKYVDKTRKEYYIGSTGAKENKLAASAMLIVGAP